MIESDIIYTAHYMLIAQQVVTVTETIAFIMCPPTIRPTVHYKVKQPCSQLHKSGRQNRRVFEFLPRDAL